MIKLSITQMYLEHRLSAPLQLHLHSRLNPGITGLGQDNFKTRPETFKFGHLVRLILEILRYSIYYPKRRESSWKHIFSSLVARQVVISITRAVPPVTTNLASLYFLVYNCIYTHRLTLPGVPDSNIIFQTSFFVVSQFKVFQVLLWYFPGRCRKVP